MMLLASLSISVSSCCDTDDVINDVTPTTPVEENKPSTLQFYSTTDVPNGYNIGVVNKDNNNVYFVADNNGNGTGDVNRVNFVLNNGNGANGNGVVIFNDNKVRSMTVNGVTYTFHQNENGKVDVAVTYNNVSELYSNVADAQLIGIAPTDNKIAAAFKGVGNSAEIASSVNSLINNESALYAYINGLQAYLSSLKGDSQWLGNDGNTGQLITNPGNQPVNVDKDAVAETDNVANNNTNSGNGAVVSGKGALKVTLTWFFPSDIDLHVFEPGFVTTTGHIYYAASRNSFTDGYLDIDNRSGYYINPLTGESNTSLAAVENIYWKESPQDGVYKLCLDNFTNTRSGMCNLAVYKDGRSIYSKDVMINVNDRVKYIVSVRMPQGEIIEEQGTRSGSSYVDGVSIPEKNYSEFRIF